MRQEAAPAIFLTKSHPRIEEHDGPIEDSTLNKSTPAERTIFITVFLLSLCVLAYEVALTRLFSVVLRYHFVFMVVSIAVCGLGLGGLALYQFANRERDARESLRFLARLSLAFSVSIALGLVFLLKVLLQYHPTWYLVTGVVILIPFFFAGMFLACAFRLLAHESGRLYFADLAGAALASLLVIALLEFLGAINAVLAVAVLGCGCALMLALAARAPDGDSRRSPAADAFCSAAALALIVLALLVNGHGRFLDIPIVRAGDAVVTKPLFMELGNPASNARIIDTEWSAFARTDVVEERGRPVRYIYTDGEVPTHMIRFDGDLAKVDRLRKFIGYLPYLTGPKNEVLCIGPGGGMDVLLGLLGGAKQIDGVEINPSIVRIVNRYGDYNGRIYQYPNVNVVTDEGRSFLRRSVKRYDLIYLALTQTATAGNVGLALMESYIHTTDAFEDYLSHLTPDGRVVVITQEYSLLMRAFCTAIAALRAGGAADDAEAAACLALLRVPDDQLRATPYRHILLLKRSPFTSDELTRLRAESERIGLVPVFLPGFAESEPFSLVRSPAGVAAVVDHARRELKANIEPCRDDCPFFFDLSFGVPGELIQLSIGALLLIVLFSVFSVFTGRALAVPRGSLLTHFLYFSALGIGFMLIEIPLAQKMILFLGYPTLALAVILFSLLLGGAIGSYVSQRAVRVGLGRGAFLAALAVVFLTLACSALIPAIQSQWLRQGLLHRSLITMLTLLPLGVALGMPFPTGLRALGQIQPALIPWAWGVNGVTSVVGSLLAVMMAKYVGFQTVLLCGAAVYFAAALIALRMRPPAEEK